MKKNLKGAQCSISNRCQGAIQLNDYSSPTSIRYHYLRMAQNNFREYLKGDTVWLKKYFYVLRPLLAVNWIERDLGLVPTEFQVLVDRIVSEPVLKNAVESLIREKRGGKELDFGPRIDPISVYIERELDRLDMHDIEF